MSYALLSLALVIMCSCSGGGDEVRVDANQLDTGVTLAVDDPDAVVRSAVLFLSNASGRGADDSIVVSYENGPFCGLLPFVRVTMDSQQNLLVAIQRRQPSGECDSSNLTLRLELELEEGVVVKHVSQEVS
jgi:hypothetical protein